MARRPVGHDDATDIADGPAGPAVQRLDKWLWHARVVKTRTAAADLVTEGKVRIDGRRVDKPAQTVKPGEVVTIVLRSGVRLFRVLGFSERRGGAPAAAALFEDLSPPPPRASKDAGGDGATRTAHRDRGAGRPTKRDRRQTDRLRGGQDG